LPIPLMLDVFIRNCNEFKTRVIAIAARARDGLIRIILTSMWIIIATRSSHSESFEKKDLDFTTPAGLQAIGESVAPLMFGTTIKQAS
jgi:hypothetical protein